MLLLEAFCSAKLCVKGGIESGPMTGNGHKMAILDHFCCLMGVLSAKNGFSVKKYIKLSGKTISTDFRFVFWVRIIIRDWSLITKVTGRREFL